jgi:putative transcriptional regulator
VEIYYEVILMEIISRLKVIFAERNIKQNEFCKKIRIRPSTLSQLVNSKTIPTLEVAYRIAVELDLNVMEIWVLKQEEPTPE